MSVTSSSNQTLVHAKPDKAISPSLAAPSEAQPEPDSIKPTSAIPPLEAPDTESESNTVIISTPQEQATKQQLDEEIEPAVEKLNNFMSSMKRDLEFSFDKESNRSVVTVRDTATQEVVRQLPSEAALKLAKVLQDSQSLPSESIGQLLDVKI